MKNNKGITLIALVITIIVLIILAGVTINLTLGQNGIFNKAEEAKEEQYQASERDALELILSEANIEKATNDEYNSNDFLTNMFENEGMIVDSNIVTVDRYRFQIDREKLIIVNMLGESNVRILTQTKEYLGKSEDNKYLVSVELKIESDVDINTMEIQMPDGTKEEINEAFKKNVNETLGFTMDPVVSSDIIGSHYGALVDGLLTSILEVDGKQLVKVVAWYDNEMGYSTQMVRTAKYLGNLMK